MRLTVNPGSPLPTVFVDVGRRVRGCQVNPMAASGQFDGNRRSHRGLAHASLAHRQDDSPARQSDFIHQFHQGRRQGCGCDVLRIQLVRNCATICLEEASQGCHPQEIMGSQCQLGAWKCGECFGKSRQGISTAPFHCGGDRIIGCRRMEDAVDNQMLVAHPQQRQLSAASRRFGQGG